MDLWVVAAATGAGYLAKYLQNSAEEKEELSESSSRILDQTSPFCRLARKRGSKHRDVFSRRVEDVTYGNYEISDILTLNSLQENVGEKREYMDFLVNGGDVLHELETNELTRIGPLKSREHDMFSKKPLRPLQSYLTKLNKEKIVKNGYTFNPLPLPSPSIPFVGPLIANGIINRDASDLFGEFSNDFSFREKNELLGSRISRESGLAELPRTGKHKVGKDQMNIAGSGETLLSQGPLNGMVLFFAGITIGIISSVIANKRELDNINAQLKLKENLVRDLHEEIEMRDRLNVKEIFKEDNQSMESSSKHELEESTKHCGEEWDDQNKDNPELMSKIEAELEAELEKLELSISSSGLERISDYVELDPDFETDVVQGDLKIHMTRQANAKELEPDNDASGTSTNHTHLANYVVSPWELSLRLHEVIQSRLEARIEELEQALKNSQKRPSIEWLRIITTRGSENGEVGSSSTPETQTYTYEVDDIDPPLCMSLSGEVSDDYNDAHEKEVIRMIDSAEEAPYSI